MEGFLLGLANGTSCAVYCIPALLSFLLQEGKSTRQNYLILSQFMIGRFIGYLLFSILAWIISITIFQNNEFKDFFFGVTYLVLAIFLVFYSLSGSFSNCGIKSFNKYIIKTAQVYPVLFPLLIGFIAGLNICPPFLLTFTRATATGDLWHSMVFFIMFFLGTSLFFIPVPLFGLLNRFSKLRIMAKYLTVIIAIFYFVMGMMLVIKSIVKFDALGINLLMDK